MSAEEDAPEDPGDATASAEGARGTWEADVGRSGEEWEEEEEGGAGRAEEEGCCRSRGTCSDETCRSAPSPFEKEMKTC